MREAVVHWGDSAVLISAKFLNSNSAFLQEDSQVVQQWCDRSQSVSPLKTVIVPLTRRRGIITYLLPGPESFVRS